MSTFRILSSSVLALFLVSTVAILSPSFVTTRTAPFSLSWLIANADEDEEEEDEDEDEDDDDDDDDEDEDEEEYQETTSKPKKIKVIQQVVEYKPVTETVIVTEEAYAKDSDGDLLVDALDPDPLIAQSEYFTDIDDDGVPNAIDRYHDEDDFAYYEMETDADNNGILDSYEAE